MLTVQLYYLYLVDVFTSAEHSHKNSPEKESGIKDSKVFSKMLRLFLDGGSTTYLLNSIQFAYLLLLQGMYNQFIV